jgi:Mg-chelatase subunit ChlI
LAFDADPEGFTAECQADNDALREKIIDAKGRIDHIEVPDRMLTAIAMVSIHFGMEGIAQTSQ